MTWPVIWTLLCEFWVHIFTFALTYICYFLTILYTINYCSGNFLYQWKWMWFTKRRRRGWSSRHGSDASPSDEAVRANHQEQYMPWHWRANRGLPIKAPWSWKKKNEQENAESLLKVASRSMLDLKNRSLWSKLNMRTTLYSRCYLKKQSQNMVMITKVHLSFHATLISFARSCWKWKIAMKFIKDVALSVMALITFLARLEWLSSISFEC